MLAMLAARQAVDRAAHLLQGLGPGRPARGLWHGRQRRFRAPAGQGAFALQREPGGQRAALAAWSDPTHMRSGVATTVALREALRHELQALAAPGGPLQGLRIAPSVANFLFLDIGRPNGPVTEALLRRGVIIKPWKEPGFEHFLRVSIGTEQDNARFVQALLVAMAEPVAV